jgi:hypothetical protein
MRAFSDQLSAFRKTFGKSAFADCYRLIAVRSIRKPEVSGWNLFSSAKGLIFPLSNLFKVLILLRTLLLLDRDWNYSIKFKAQ